MSLIKLPQTEPSPAQPLEQLLARRRCVREYADRPVTLTNAACLLWAAQGISAANGLRTSPSAGALYPMDIYLAAGAVTGLVPGIYRYLPKEGAIEGAGEGDQRAALAAAALGQPWLADAALILIIAARYEHTTWKYGQRGIQYGRPCGPERPAHGGHPEPRRGGGGGLRRQACGPGGRSFREGDATLSRTRGLSGMSERDCIALLQWALPRFNHRRDNLLSCNAQTDTSKPAITS